MSEFISAKNDVIFKMLFMQEDILKSFLSSALNIPVEDFSELVILNPELPTASADGKFSRLDIRLKTKTRSLNIEMQNVSASDYKERILYYWAKMYSEPLKQGQSYKELNQSISISVLNYKMFDCTEYHSVFKLLETSRNELFTDKMEMHFFELPKISEIPDRNDLQQMWLHVINAASEEELNMLNQMNVPIINRGIKTIFELNADEKIRSLAWERERAENDYNSGLINAKREESDSFISAMRASGMSEEAIQNVLNIKNAQK